MEFQLRVLGVTTTEKPGFDRASPMARCARLAAWPRPSGRVRSKLLSTKLTIGSRDP